LTRRGGVTSYLEALDSGTRLFSADLGSRAQSTKLRAFVEISRSLGGGSQQR
jgi:hypothetical protein